MPSCPGIDCAWYIEHSPFHDNITNIDGTDLFFPVTAIALIPLVERSDIILPCDQNKNPLNQF